MFAKGAANTFTKTRHRNGWESRTLYLEGLWYNTNIFPNIPGCCFFLIALEYSFVFIFRFYLFIFRKGKGRRNRQRNINVWLPLTCPLLETWPVTQAGALTGNQTRDPLVHRPTLNPLSHTSQGYGAFSCIINFMSQKWKSKFCISFRNN